MLTQHSRRWLAGAAGVALLAAGAAGGNRPAAADSAAVGINNFAFMPASITVTAGSTVTWTDNQSGVPHTVTADDGSFDSGRLTTGQSFSMTFSAAGTITYHCNIHPSMHGTITVMASQASAGSPVPSGNGGAANSTGSNGNAGSAAPSGGRTVSLSAGYNLVGPPDGTTFGDATAFAFDPTANTYHQLSAGEQTQGGQGYWLLSDNGGSMPLAAGSDAPVTFMATPGTWQLIGDPSGTQAALVTGADAVWTYNASTGQYEPATMLQPGQGAWAISRAGGKITITPGGQAATPTPTPSPTPRPTQQPQAQPVQTPQPATTPYVYPRPYYGPVVVSPMMPMPMPRPMPMPY